LAIDKPQLALAEEPFTAHPGDYLQWHPIDKFGCTVCHGGQGLATESAAAHGDVKHWEEPLLRGELVQASCRQCHGDLRAIEPHVPLLVKGRQLFQAEGCYGCHVVHDFGQTVSSDLSEIGSKSYLLLEADFEMMPQPHDRIHWFMRKLRHPRMLNPGVRPEELPEGEEEVFPTTMPHFGLTEDEIRALTVYLLSLTAHDFPSSYVRPPKPEPVPTYTSDIEHGKAVFEKFGCTACHGVEGVGGRRNWNAGLGQEVPSLLYVKAYYGHDVDSLKHLIRNGRQPVPRADATRPQPGLYMPAWKDRISEEELDALVAYLFSLADRLPQSAAVEEPATSAN
jgi:mono/diheme cytochrome c family protein